MEYQERKSLIETILTFKHEPLILKGITPKQEDEHKGYADMLKAFNKVVRLKIRLVNSFNIEFKGNRFTYKFTIPLTEAAELVKEIEKAQKEYDEVPKFRVNVKTIRTIEAV
jgi:hypothetical protein